MINIADILKDCPKGTKLYSPICGNCNLLKIYNGLGFDVINDTDEVFNFSYDGRYNLNGECCIFPSKDKRDWNTFRPFKDGDILTYTSNHTTTFIYRNKDNEPHFSTSFYVACNDATSHNFLIYNKYTLIALNENCDVRLATEDEKIKLFDAIKANGYKWNAETKTLEKLIVPKFKVGEEIVRKNSITNSFIVNSVSSEYYGLVLPDRTGVGVLNVSEQDDWELVLPIHKFKVGDIVKSNMNNKFDISTLKAYNKVLVRDDNNSAWINTFFGFYDTVTNKKYPFIAGSVNWAQCIPYEGNEHLLGTCDECDEYYKNW